ncbi:thiamine pyrophosphate-binding protein [Staphylococcus aureus]
MWIIYSVTGGAVLPLYDTFYDGKIKHILARHEQGAVHACRRLCTCIWKPGVVVVTSGPGATNVMTGITDAHCDLLPSVVFTGQVATPGIGKDAFQEADILIYDFTNYKDIIK